MKMNKSNALDLNKYLDPHLEDKIMALPLEFEYLPVEIISKQFTKLNSQHHYRIHYLGPRFTNTLILHKKYSGSSSTNQNSKEMHLFQKIYQYEKYGVQLRKIVQSNYMNEKLQNNHYYKSAIFYRAFEGMNPTLSLKDEILFNSCFESGNLDCVIKVNPNQFDLFLRIDSNTRGHTQWFFFSVQNGKRKGKITFHLCNLTKPRTLYELGMRPYVFSKKKYEKGSAQWQQDGSNVELIEKKLRYELIEEMIDSPCVYRLSFDYDFEYEDDEVFFAYTIPYTYSQMLKDISMLPKRFAKTQVLGRSLTGVDIPILHIANHDQKSDQETSEQRKKKNVLITGRIHPGQSNGSHLLKGFIDFLCAGSPQANELRERMNFFIVPMINPDGVIMGNSRSCASGKDLNRQYLSAKKELYPQVHLVKNLAYKLQRNEGLFMFFDFHGHSRKKNTFFYGPGYSLSDPEYYKSRALSKIIQKINNSFRYYSCSFMISQQKKRTARAVLFDQVKIPYVFTIQSSIGLYYDCTKLKTLQFGEEDWKTMGVNICQGLSDFIVAYEDFEEVIRERRLQRKKRKERLNQTKKIPGSQKKFMEDDLENEEQGTKKPQSMLMLQLMQEIKQMPPPKNGMDPEASSDDHDDAEDLQTSKLAEFNTLVIQSKQKDQMNSHKLSKIQQQIEEPILQPKRTDTESDQLQLVQEIVEAKKPAKPTIKSSQGSSHQAMTVHNIASNKINPGEKIFARRSTPFGTKSMKLGEQTTPNNSTKSIKEQCAHKRNTNLQARHLISKQFFPMERCEIVELPKSSLTNRKEIKKGRVMIEEYLSDKMKQKQLKEQQAIKVKHQKNKSSFNEKLRRKESVSEEQQNSSSINKLSKFKAEELISNKVVYQRPIGFIERKTVSSNKDPTTSQSKSQRSRSMRIFDSVVFSGFQGMEVDNMAMMIRTFNR